MAVCSTATNSWMLPRTGSRRSVGHGATTVCRTGAAHRSRWEAALPPKSVNGPPNLGGGGDSDAEGSGRSKEVTLSLPKSTLESTVMPGWSCSGIALPAGKTKMPTEMSWSA